MDERISEGETERRKWCKREWCERRDGLGIRVSHFK